ncbi:MAG TPA: helical backbone metal receptor, partial [Solirubrobacterales bacterium]|nr:helical backbone metal receptor [Solirubrobacterales bacterium]
AEAEALCGRFEQAYERAAASADAEQRVLYLIWRDPWMTVARETYIAQTLELFNWRTQPSVLCNPQGDKGQRVRYPEVDLGDFAGKVDRVLLSSEPFHFKERHVAEVEELVPGAAVSLIDGEMTSWYGSRAIAGLEYLADYTR